MRSKSQNNRRLEKRNHGVACGKRALLMKTATSNSQARDIAAHRQILTGPRATLLSIFFFFLSKHKLLKYLNYMVEVSLQKLYSEKSVI